MADRSKILVVEDNLGTRSMIEFALEFEGYSVTGIGDGLSVAGALASERPNLVILDVMMPGRDGAGRDLLRTRDERHHAAVSVSSRWMVSSSVFVSKGLFMK